MVTHHPPPPVTRKHDPLWEAYNAARQRAWSVQPGQPGYEQAQYAAHSAYARWIATCPECGAVR